MKDENIHIGELLKQYIHYWKIYIPIGIICLIGAIIFILVIPKEYEIVAKIQLMGEKNGMMSELKMLKSSAIGGLLGGGGNSANTENEIVLMTSRNNLINVIRKTQYQIETTTRNRLKKVILSKKESPVTYTFPIAFLDTLSKPITIKLNILNNNIQKIKVESYLFDDIIIKSQSFPYDLVLPIGTITIVSDGKANGNYTTKITPLQKAFETLSEDIYIYPSEKMTDILTLSYRTSNQKIGCELLNTVMDSYNDYSKKVKMQDADLNSYFVRERLDTITMELALLEHQIEKYKQSNNIPNPILYGEATYMGNQEIEKMILETETRLRMLDYVISYMKDPANSYSAVPIISETGEKAIAIYNELILNRQRLLQSSERNNPALILAENQLKEQRKMLFESIQSIRENIQINLNALKQKNSSLTKLIDKLPTQEREYIEMKRQQRIKETMYLFLMQKLQEKELVNSPDEFAGRTIDKAYASYKHTYPKSSIVLIVAFILACIISLTVISIKVFTFEKDKK